ncbi:MAG: hypothetical protein M0R73_10230 [Dehalococcoidia bacterium]|nr:hypothetical protein [Dehalococcoidia bacterium]
MDPSTEAALLAWMHDVLGVEGYRRVVRATRDEVLVSKFEPGFAARLHSLLDELPEIFDEDTVVEAYQRAAHDLPADTPRVDAWHAAMHGALAALGERLGVEDHRLAEVRVGIDSVRAVLEAVIWSAPSVTDEYSPRNGEVEAYRDGMAALADDRDIFTRYYGDFDGRPVVNHCPGAQFARRMLAQGWLACTGTQPPV